MTQIYDFPTLTVSKCLFVPQFNTQISKNKFSGHEHVIENPGERWVVQYRFAALTTDEAKVLKSHLALLRGAVNKTRLYDTTFKKQSGTWAGTPRIKGAGQYGTVLKTDGYAANQLVAAAMDRCLIGEQLMEICQDSYSDQYGNATLYTTNELREPASDNAIITSDVSALKTVGRWTNPEQIRQLSGNRRLYRNITLDFIEAFV